MKDYQKENDKLKAELSEVRKQLTYERNLREDKEDSNIEFRRAFRQLLLDALS
jgi:hypothetical protein